MASRSEISGSRGWFSAFGKVSPPRMATTEPAADTEAFQMTRKVAARMASVSGLLAAALRTRVESNLDTLLAETCIPEFKPGALGKPVPPPRAEEFLPARPKTISRLRRGNFADVVAARQALIEAQERHAEAEAQRRERLDAARREHDLKVAEARRRAVERVANKDTFVAKLRSHDSDAISEYFTLVLRRSVYPAGFPRGRRVRYVEGTRSLFVDFDLPRAGVVPVNQAYSYSPTTGSVEPVPRTEADIRTAYGSIVAQCALRTGYELFQADRGSWVSDVVFRGLASDQSGARVCVVTARMASDQASRISLAQNDPVECLLSWFDGAVSQYPDRLEPVKVITRQSSYLTARHAV